MSDEAESKPETPAPIPSGRAKASWLARLAALGLTRPRITVGLALLTIFVCGAYAVGMPVSTSRYKLVSADNPYQARLLRFFERFGYPDALVLVISGDDAAQRRKAVDQLTERYEAEEELKGRVLGRLRVDEVAELLLLAQPDTLDRMRNRLDAEPAEVIEGGFPRWVQAVTDQLYEGLDGADAKQAEIDDGLKNLTKLLRSFDAHLAGQDALRELPSFEKADLPNDGSMDDRGYLVSEAGDLHFVALFPDLPGAEGSEVKPMVDKVRRIREELALEGVTVRVTGLPALVADELVIVERGIAQTSGATTAGILLLLLIAFRSFRYTILALIPLGVGVVLTLAATRGVYGGLNLVTSTFIPVLLALGIDFGVYVLSRYGELVREGASTDEAIRGSISKAGPGMLIGAVTTMLAFLMTAVIEFTAYSELGVITAVGLALMVGVTFLVLPALIFLAGRGEKIESPELSGVARLPSLIRAGGRALPLAALVAVVGLALTFPNLRFNARYFDFLPDESESAWALHQIEHDRFLSPVQASSGTEGIEEARVLAAKLRELPSVGAVHTASDMFPALDDAKLKQLRAGFADTRRPDFDKLRTRSRSAKELAGKVRDLVDALDEVAFPLRQAGRSTKAIDDAKKAALDLQKRIASLPDDAPVLAEAERRVAGYLERAWTTAQAVADRGGYQSEDLPSVFRARFGAKEGNGVAVFVTPAKNIWEANNAAEFAAEVQGVEPQISGLAVTIHEHMRMIKEGFRNASLLSGLLVFVVLFVGLRRVGDVLFSLIPVLFGSALMLGTMSLFDVPFNVANVVALPLILGVAVDAGAHMVHRWRQSADEHGGVGRLDEVIRGTGAAVVMASLTTATGFAALMISDYGGMRTLGLSMTIGIVGSLVGAVVILPAVLVGLKRAE